MSHEKPVSVVYDRTDMPKDVLKCLKIAMNESINDYGGKLIGLAGSYEFTMLKGIAL